MKTTFTIWRTNLGFALLLLVLAAFEAALMVYWGWSDSKRAIMMVLQANIELYAIYMVATQSNFKFLKGDALPFVILKQTAFAIIYTLAIIWTWKTFFPYTFEIGIPGKIFYGILFFSWILLLTMGIIHYLVDCLIEQEQKILLENGVQQLKNEAELFKLRQQLHPHFLFNSLNSINALIAADPKQARYMIAKLSAFLRQSIKKEDDRLVPLQSELDELEMYLDIERVRFGDRLVIVKKLPDTLSEKFIPPFLLQPLVENAIKFGLYDTLGEVEIGIRLQENEHFFIFEISNPFDKDSVAPKGTGFGIEGVKRRLYLLYARNDLLQIERRSATESGANDMYFAKLMIPKQTSENI